MWFSEGKFARPVLWPPHILLLILSVLQISEDLGGLFSDLEPSPENEVKAPESHKILNYYKIYD